MQRKAGAVSIKIRALSEAAHKTKEMPLTSHFLALEAPNPCCGVTICDIPWIVLPNELFIDLFTWYFFTGCILFILFYFYLHSGHE